MKAFQNLVGEQFGRLFPLERIGTKWESPLWRCGCICGNYSENTTGDLTRTTKPRRTCGKCYDHVKYPKEWIAWRNMINRCEDIKNKDYFNYGAKGISVCKEWRWDFMAFLIHIGMAPDTYYTLDRIESTGNYEPGNVRWATRTIQNLNRCTTHSIHSKIKLRQLLNKLNQDKESSI
jgi:hypothetical protein